VEWLIVTGQPAENFGPLFDVKGHITHWLCSQCFWTIPISAEFTGMAPSRAVVTAFGQHNCQAHRESKQAS
jgi:hypothetical protein